MLEEPLRELPLRHVVAWTMRGVHLRDRLPADRPRPGLPCGTGQCRSSSAEATNGSARLGGACTVPAVPDHLANLDFEYFAYVPYDTRASRDEPEVPLIQDRARRRREFLTELRQIEIEHRRLLSARPAGRGLTLEDMAADPTVRVKVLGAPRILAGPERQ